MTELVGIANITPDSFSDGGQFIDPNKAITHIEQLFGDGASIVDIGAESTRPHATPLTDEEEWQRLEPVLTKLIPHYPGQLSIDSYHPSTIKRAFAIGSVIVNDVTGLRDQKMIELVVTLQATAIISHLPDMSIEAAHQNKPVSTVEQVRHELLAKAQAMEALGLPRAHIILDPGIGFGKTKALNFELLKFGTQVPDYDVMIGYSRKGFLGVQRMELEPNIEAGRIAITHGAKYLRVHDVAGHSQSLGSALRSFNPHR